MINLTISISDQAHEILLKTCELKKQTVEEYLHEKSISYFEKLKDDPDKIQSHFNHIQKKQSEKEMKDTYAKHRAQEYYIKEPNKGKFVTIRWRTCPIPEGEKYSPVTSQHKDHIGEYSCEILHYNNNKSSLPGFNHIEKHDYHYRKTLKALKRLINKKLGYNHYKVK